MKMTNLLLAGVLSLATAQEAAGQNYMKEVEYSPEKTTFQLFAPKDAKAVTLRIYAEGQGGKPLNTVEMKFR